MTRRQQEGFWYAHDLKGNPRLLCMIAANRGRACRLEFTKLTRGWRALHTQQSTSNVSLFKWGQKERGTGTYSNTIKGLRGSWRRPSRGAPHPFLPHRTYIPSYRCLGVHQQDQAHDTAKTAVTGTFRTYMRQGCRLAENNRSCCTQGAGRCGMIDSDTDTLDMPTYYLSPAKRHEPSPQPPCPRLSPPLTELFPWN